jgi:hypothetical protein
MQDAANHATIIHALLAANVGRQIRVNRSPLIVIQPKEIASHITAPNHRSKANQQPIQPAISLC